VSGTKETRSAGAGWFGKILILLAVASLGLLATVPFDWRDQALFGLATVILAIWINHRSSQPTATLVLVVLSVFSTLRYANWRFSETWRQMSAKGLSNLEWDVIFVLLLLLAEAYAILVLLLGFFQSVRPLHRTPKPLPPDWADWPTVDIYIPTYNEPLDVVRPTVLSALNVDWPPEKLRVYILDDGRRAEFREFAAECNAGYLVRPDNKGAKAGNINHAMAHTDGEYIAIFDCDHIPTRSFLQMTMGWFLKDAKLSMVQTPHYFYTPDPFEKNLGIFREVPNEGALFYGVLQDANDFWNATFFCGSCAVIRRSALAEVGGIAVETVTEDAHTALRLQRRGWRTAYIRYPQAAGLATSSLADHIGQRIRWARGMVQILRLDFPLLGRGLSFAQRLCYLNATLHYLYALPRLIFLTAPLFYLLLNRSNVYGYVGTILAYALPHLALAITANSRIQGRYRHSFWNEVYETVLAPYILLPTLAALVSPRHGKFNVTPKSHGSDRSYFAWKVAVPLLVLLTLNTTGIVYGGLRMLTEPERMGPLCMNIFWALLNVIVLGASVAVANEQRQRRKEARLTRQHGAHLILPDGRVLAGETVDLSTGGAAVSLQGAADLSAGAAVNLLIAAPTEEVAVSAVVVGGTGSVVRLNFPDAGLRQLEALTRIIFTDADLWLFGHYAKQPDRPWRSFRRIVGISMGGLLLVPKLLFWRQDEGAPAAPPVERSPSGLPVPLLALALAGWSLLGGGPALQAQPVPSAAASAPVLLHSFDEARELRSFGQRQPLALRGSEAQTAVSFALPVTKVATSASLGLHYRLSPALTPGASILNIILNGSPVAAVPLERGSAAPNAYTHAQVEIPAELLVGQNTLTFQLQGRCALGCTGDEDDAPTLIAESTTLRMAGEVIPMPNDLSRFPLPFFDLAAPTALELSFVFPAQSGPAEWQAAGLLASYFGSLADHRGSRFPVARDTMPQGNVVLLALAESPEIYGLGLTGIPGPMVAVRDNPADPSAKILIVGGRDSAELLSAARAIVLGAAVRAADSVLVEDTPGLPPVRGAYDAPRWLPTGGVIRIGDHARVEDLKVEGAGPVQWYFRLPPDLHFGQRETVPLRLHYRYAGLPRGARAEIRIRINGVQVGVRRLDPGAREASLRELIQIPVASLYPRNTLTIDFQYFDEAGRRPAPGPGAPSGLVLRDSELDLTSLAHFTRLPRLDLFAKAGFPFTRHADLSETAVVMPAAPSPEELSAFLQLAGFFGAQTGHPALRLEVVEAAQAERISSKDLLVIGTPASQLLYRKWEWLMPVRLGSREYALNRPASTWHRLLSFPVTAQGRARSRLQDLLAGSAPHGLLLQAFVSPLNPRRSVVAVSAAAPAGFAGLPVLIEQGQGDSTLDGNVAVESNGLFVSYQIPAGTYYLGSLEWREAIDFWVVRYLWILPVLVIMLALLLARATLRWADARAGARLRAEI
jgi:cellulose synthase (UDP-forming)